MEYIDNLDLLVYHIDTVTEFMEFTDVSDLE